MNENNKIDEDKKPSDNLVLVTKNGISEVLADKNSKLLKKLLKKDNNCVAIPLSEALNDKSIVIPIPSEFDDINEFIAYYNAIHESVTDTHTIEANVPYVSESKKLYRNDICSCGSNKKYKNCCLKH